MKAPKFKPKPTVARTAREKRIGMVAVAFCMAMIFVVSGFTVGKIITSPDNPAKVQGTGPRVEVGDVLEMNIAVYDDEGRLLYSSRQSQADELGKVAETYQGDFVVPTQFSPIGLLVDDGTSPYHLGDLVALPIGSQLVGQGIGYSLFVETLGSWPGYVETTTMQRLRGPFNTSFQMDVDGLDQFATKREGNAVVLDDLLNATIIDERGDELTLEVDLVDGTLLHVRQAEFRAEVIRPAGASTFNFYLHTENGHSFSVTRSCEFAGYVLPKGSYQVAAINDTHIELLQSPTPFPQLMGQNTWVQMEVVAIHKSAVPTTPG